MMITSKRGLIKAGLISLTLLFTACGTDELDSKDKRSAEITGEEQAAANGDCFGLYNKKGPGQSPTQGRVPVYHKKAPTQRPTPKYENRRTYAPKQNYNRPVQTPHHKQGPKVVRRPCDRPNQGQKYRPHQGKHIQPRPPVFKRPTQSCKSDCNKRNYTNRRDNVYMPIKPGTEPSPWPTQRPVDRNKCGTNGKYCNHPGQNNPAQHQFPSKTVHGRDYNQADVSACMGAFHRAGMKQGGMWGVNAKKIRSVSVLSQDVIEDYGNDRNIVLIKSVNVLGGMDFHLMNPNALYCIKDVSVFSKIRITSCHTSNVVVGNSVSVLSDIDTRVVQCR